MRDPLMHRMPSPNTIDGCSDAAAWKKRQAVVGGRLCAVSTVVSWTVEREPPTDKPAPDGLAELAQPRPDVPLLPHGHGVAKELPSPKQKPNALPPSLPSNSPPYTSEVDASVCHSAR